MSGEKDCVFCKIVRGEIPASVVMEDELSMVIMDIFPVTRGHCLLIPKQHFTNMLDVAPDVAAHLAKNLSIITRRVRSAMSSDGVINIIANGEGAGQEVPHLHIHVIPRNKGDPFGFRFPPNYREKMADRAELDKTAKQIHDA